jgi:hypothetical protein
MKCENKSCGRELTSREPVYRCLVALRQPTEYELHAHQVLNVCGDCAKTRKQWDRRAKNRPPYAYRDPLYGNVYQPLRWNAPQSCEHCGRTVIHDSSVQPQIIACSNQCRRAIYNASRRRAAMTVCSECGGLFTPSRSGALYCSAACKQKAYRDRHR